MSDRGPLAGRHVIITGASSGIGRAAAVKVAAKGATVFLLARRSHELESVVEEIRRLDGRAFAYQCDVTESESVDQTIKAVLEQHGHVDMLVNNAGRSIRRSVYRSTDRLHDYERTMAVNYFGAVRMVLALLPHMKERKFGHVVNISSTGVQASSPRFSAYLASKAALDKFTDVVAAETASDKITFTTIHMPLIDTPMIAPTGEQLSGTGAASPEWAAATIVRALVERPKRIDTPIGTITEYWALVAPQLKDRFFHQYYRRFPDSAAAKGESRETPTHSPAPKQSKPGPVPLRIAGKAARRMARWVPGTQW